MELQLIKHKDILFKDILRAVAIKSIAWPFPLESQIKWIVDNMQDEDQHVFLKEGDTDCAYMTLSPVSGLMNGVPTSFMGVGCVCSATTGQGFGKLLIVNINKFLFDNNQRGLLFCKENLLNFYGKYDWKLIPSDKVHFEKSHKNVFTMVYNVEDIQRLDYADRFF